MFGKKIRTLFGNVTQKEYEESLTSMQSRLLDSTLLAGASGKNLKFALREEKYDVGGSQKANLLVSVKDKTGQTVNEFPAAMWPGFQTFLFQRVQGNTTEGHIKVTNDDGMPTMYFIEVRYSADPKYLLEIVYKD